MRIILTEENHLTMKNIILNDNPNIWITDFNKNNIINIIKKDNVISLISNKNYKLISNSSDKDNYIDSLELCNNSKYTINCIFDNSIYYLYTFDESIFDKKIVKLKNGVSTINIAGNYYSNSDIIFQDKEYDYSQISLTKNGNLYEIKLNNIPYYIFKGKVLLKENYIKFGETLFLDGIFFTLIDDILLIINSNNRLNISKNNVIEIQDDEVNYNDYFKISNVSEADSIIKFRRVPKIQRKIENKVFQIDPPTSPEVKDDMPILYTLMPMMLMSMTSMFSGINIINQISTKEKTIKESLPGLVMVFAMILAMVIFPLITNMYKKRRSKTREKTRVEEYKDYMYEMKRKIDEEINFQKDVLLNSYYDTNKSKDIIENMTNLLWERKKDNEDFLCISLGNGNIAPFIEIKTPQEHFSIDEDKLMEQLVHLEDETDTMKDVPIVFDFLSNNVVSFIGKNEVITNYYRNLLIRIFAVCSFEDLKIVILTNKENKNFWKQYIDLPYIWNEDKSVRFYGDDEVSYQVIINYLDEIYRQRSNVEENTNITINTNYLLFIDDIQSIKNIPMITDIIKNTVNYGFTVVFNTPKIDLLPSECKNFIYIENNKGKFISNVNKNYYEKEFVPELLYSDYTKCYQVLSNIYLDSFEKKFLLPTKYDFLEMYKVGNINSLNILSRWQNNNTVDSLGVPIGIGENGDLLYLNIHENSHGPHGLVAGMTGSGKSELLITYILSLAINYNPEKVQFVLIDYKGGGLANTFYNSNVGMILPHVVGVITNINENEINRSLISLQSEIKRRQKIFAEVSIKYNEGNMDIYKYEELYIANRDIEPLSHLLIISDEFAELKSQNPEFISQLISIARIGRSLGVHLILATQKPSGVVDDQIWSNSRFKVCLKVQDKTDSNDMIKMPDAAYIKETGRFFLQVGFNELFIKGQSAYTGFEYFEKEDNNAVVDERIEFVNDYGKRYHFVDSKDDESLVGQGKIISNIVKYIIQLSKDCNYNVKGLWRELIPENIYYNELTLKYEFNSSEFVSALIGEYDAPDLQKKGPVILDIANSGNIIIYGLMGSGKEMILETMLYSIITNYSPDDVNIYILDFGSEVLNGFSSAPQIGDIIYVTDEEKINNTFKYITKLINDRKKIFSEYNGDFVTYNTKSGNKLPSIIVVINVLETLFENYDDLTDVFLTITRECSRYGIIFVVTTNGVNNIRSKLLQGFKKSIALDLKDNYDYTTIFGSRVNIKPTKNKGRGLINMENIYEFQTATLNNEKDNQDVILETVKNLNLLYDVKARPIPVLPNIVTYDIIKNHLVNNTDLPIGIVVENLNVKKYDFFGKNTNIITSLDIEPLERFIYSLEKNILSFNNNKLFIFSSIKRNNIHYQTQNIINSNYSNYLEELEKYVQSSNSKVMNYICFLGINDIYSTFDLNIKKKFSELLKIINSKDNFITILVDASNNIKKLEFEDFYKNSVNNMRGLWIGNGVSEQMILKYSKLPREYRELTDNNYGFVFDNSIVEKIKLINYLGEENEE